jgi:hypothetical protein
MTVRRLNRPVLHRDDNDAQVAGYGRSLLAIFEDWLQRSGEAGLSVLSLGARLQQAAEGAFPSAYLRGKRQAYPPAVIGPDDRQWLERALRQNRGYVYQHLERDIEQKATFQRMEGTDLQALRKTFGSRIEFQYGGQLWQVTEAGFVSGCRDLSAAIRIHFRLPIHQEDDEQDDHEDDEATLAALAVLLGISQRALSRLMTRAGASVSDLQNVDSAPTRRLAEALGVAPDRVATAANEAVSGVVQSPTATTADLAAALGVSEAEVLSLGAALQRGEAWRAGVAYQTQNDGDVCLPCQEAGAGGENGDGVYWAPDEPPLPGDNCRGKGNCRCWLESVWEMPEPIAA